MSRAEILAKITEILSDLVEDEKLVLSERTAADSVANWDSVNHVKLLIALESDLGIEFDSEEIGSLEAVGGLIDVIENKLAA